MTNATVTVARITNKSVTTKYGPKPTYSFQGTDNEWYSMGFKKPRFNAGDELSFDYTENTYGKQVDDATIVIAGGGTPMKGKSVMPTSAPNAKPAYQPNNRVFPIPPLAGERAIIRQNALTNAREVYVASCGSVFPMDDEVISSAIIDLARKFEAYTAGDLDTAMAEKMMEEKNA